FACVAAYFLKCDYSYAGILAMIALYFFRQDHVKSIFACCIILICGYSNEVYAIFSVLPILFYNGERGNTNKLLKYAFYAVYPVHLLIIACIQNLF
nr:conjugal transfer protein TraX [Lachnospiraceae bacterium]